MIMKGYFILIDRESGKKFFKIFFKRFFIFSLKFDVWVGDRRFGRGYFTFLFLVCLFVKIGIIDGF